MGQKVAAHLHGRKVGCANEQNTVLPAAVSPQSIVGTPLVISMLIHLCQKSLPDFEGLAVGNLEKFVTKVAAQTVFVIIQFFLSQPPQYRRVVKVVRPFGSRNKKILFCNIKHDYSTPVNLKPTIVKHYRNLGYSLIVKRPLYY